MFKPLRAAIAAQYEAFRVAQPMSVTGCQCCTTPRELAALVAKPRQELGPRELDFYARKALTTVGGQDDLRYFWPRMAELTIAGELLTDTEIVFGKLRLGEHTTWPAQEQRALTQFATALGDRLAAEELEAGEVDEWVCAISILSEGLHDPRAFLRPLLLGTPEAWANLRQLIRWNRNALRKKGQLGNAFWEAAPGNAKVVFEWLTSEPRALEAALAVEGEDTEQYGTVPPDVLWPREYRGPAS